MWGGVGRQGERMRVAVMGLCLALAVWAVPLLHARAAVQAAAAKPGAAETPHISQAQAQQLLGVLQDDGRRKQFVETLKNLSQAQAQTGTQAETPTGTATGSAPASPQFKPDSLGADILGGASIMGSTASHKAKAVLHTVLDFREVGGWARQITGRADERTEVLRILMRAAIFIGLATGVFLLATLLLRRPRNALIKIARRNAYSDEIDAAREHEEAAEAAERDAQTQAENTVEADLQKAPENAGASADAGPIIREAGEEAHEEQAARMRHQGALARLMASIRRAPFALGCLLLDLIPVALVGAVALVLSAVDPTGDGLLEATIRTLALTGVSALALIAVLRICLSPRYDWIRLLAVSDGTASFLLSWMRRLIIVASVGAAAIIVLDACFLPGRVVGALVKILALAIHLLIAVMILRSRGYVAAFCAQGARKGYVSSLLVLFGRIWWVVALFFDLGLWLVWAAEIRNGYEAIWTVFLRSLLALVIVRVVAIAAFGLLERAFRKAPEWSVLTDDAKARLGTYYPILRRIVGCIVVVTAVFALAVAWGVPVRALFGRGEIGSRIASSLFTILVALTIAALVWELVNIAIERHVRRIGDLDDGKVRVARIRTLQPMMRIILLVVLAAILILTVLSEIGINTAPLLAGASIFGVAIGFGSQKLVQDFINGIFLLLENALTVGDSVSLNGVGGTVERLSLRTVHVRGSDGSINIFPFSSLGQITNFNRDYAKAMITVGVGYDVDPDAAFKALADITAEMKADENFADLIQGDFELWGVDSLDDSSVSIKGVLRTTTAGRWPVQREFNRRIKTRFDERGITIPFPTRTLEIDGMDALVARAREGASDARHEPPAAALPAPK